jgi:thimet oligopeptidase
MTEPTERSPTSRVSSSETGLRSDPGLLTTAQAIVENCDEQLAEARACVDAVRALAECPPAALTWDSVLAPLDEVHHRLGLAGGFASLMEEVHPDAEVRERARSCRPRIVAFHTDLLLDAELAKAVRRFAEKAEPLAGTRARFLADLLRDFRRNGLELDPAGQAELRALNEELTQLEQAFAQNLSESSASIRVHASRLRGLPDAFLGQHPPDAEGQVTLTTDYPDYFPVVTYAEDRELARELNFLFDRRAAEPNLKTLARVLELRETKAKLLGYASWAAYAVEPRMARVPEAVERFLERAAEVVRGPAQAEFELLAREQRALGGRIEADGRIPTYERLYLEQRLAASCYGFDSKAFTEYFEVSRVVEGALRLAEELFGVEFVDDGELPRWHPDVRVLEVREQGRRVARVYMDLYPREHKYKHAAMFEIRAGKLLADGSYVEPIAGLVCNFQKPGAATALLSHDEVSTFFHELGHVLHHVLTREALATYAGTTTAQDFVEVPSQLFEEWSYERSVIDRFAAHHRTGERVPEQLFAAFKRSRAFGRALATQRQLSLALLDFTYHSRPGPLELDAVLHEVMTKSQPFAYQAGTHFQATFGHLMGYDAGYYSYQWSLAIARDLLTRFEREGFLNPAVARDFKERVLARGAGEDEALLVRDFLGRELELDAYSRFLSEGAGGGGS